MALDRLSGSLRGARVIKKGEYDYFVHPLTDGIEKIDPDLLMEVADEINRIAEKDYERIVTVEAMGLPVTTAFSLRVNTPYTIVRKRRYGLEGEVEVVQRTGYSENRLYVNGLRAGCKILLLDVVISTGGTLRAVLSALRSIGCDIKDVIVVIEKSGEVREDLEREFGVKIKTLVSIRIENGRVVLV